MESRKIENAITDIRAHTEPLLMWTEPASSRWAKRTFQITSFDLRSLFESLTLLLRAHIADDGVDVVVVQVWDCGHVAEVPVMLLGSVEDR
jgi:hypothetical protein